MQNGNRDLKVTPPPGSSAGLKAVTSALRHLFGKMGVVRGTRGMFALNQKGGIDCQSCAWPDPEHRTINEFCENGAKALADEATTKKIEADFFAKYSIQQLQGKDDHWLNAQGRITEPLILPEGATHYQPVRWEEAFKTIASHLNALDSPDEAAFYTSGRTSNEAAFLYQLFVRQFGTNNLPDCSNMCHESTSIALAESLGLGKATIRLEDFEKTDLVLVIGQNPGTNSPRMLASLRAAKLAGAKIISINPLAEVGLSTFVDPNPQHYGRNLAAGPFALLSGRGTKLGDLHLPVRIGGDMAVLKGLMKLLLERDRKAPGTVFQKAFIDSKTDGYHDLVESLDRTNLADIFKASGLTLGQLEEAAEMIADARAMISCWAMGVTQHRAAVATIQDIVNLHLLTGQIGKPGAGLCPVRGHSNVQGDRTMGIWPSMHPTFRANLEKEFEFTAPPNDGCNTVEAIQAMLDGSIKVFFAMGGNFASATPDTRTVEKALGNCELTAQVITKLNRTALTPGTTSLILPCLGRSDIDIQATGEQFVSTESTMLNVQMSKGIFPPASEHLRSETWIVASLAKAVLGDRTAVDWERMAANYDNIRDAISRVVPGCENYNERIRVPGGFYMPSPPHRGEFSTAGGRAVFRSQPLEVMSLADGQLMLTSIRSHDQFNTTIYAVDDRYRGIYGDRRVIFMNHNDIASRELDAGMKVDVTSHFDDGARTLFGVTVIPYDIPKDCAAMYFPEANPLVPLGSVARRSFTPTSKCILVTVRAAHR